MEKLTYKQAYDKIIQAYFKDEIKPYDDKFCFCGTLCDNKSGWAICSWESVFNKKPHNDFMYYSGKEYADMERALLLPLHDVKPLTSYEDNLFAGMSAALSVLQDIHRSRGENVDDIPEFTKRHLTVIV